LAFLPLLVLFNGLPFQRALLTIYVMGWDGDHDKEALLPKPPPLLKRESSIRIDKLMITKVTIVSIPKISF